MYKLIIFSLIVIMSLAYAQMPEEETADNSSPLIPPLDPFSEVMDKTITGYLTGKTIVTGKVEKNVGQYVMIDDTQNNRKILVYKTSIVYLEWSAKNSQTTTAATKRSWSPEQATGKPDTLTHEDLSTAWASLQPNGGKEWLQVNYNQEVNIAQICIHQSFNPGAIYMVSAVFPNDSKRKEEVLWEGDAPGEQKITVLKIDVKENITASSLKIYLDTSIKKGWNEIDAVELFAKDDTSQWAKSATASSTYASSILPSSPLITATEKEALIHLKGNKIIQAHKSNHHQFFPNFTILDNSQAMTKTMIRHDKVVYVEWPAKPKKK